MNDTDLGALFELSNDAVVGVKDGKICFVNPIAERFYRLRVGDDASRHFPAELLSGTQRAASSLVINGLPADITLRRMEPLTLLCMRTPERSDSVDFVSRIARPFADSLMITRMALDALLRRLRKPFDPSAMDYAAILYKEYYNQRRLCTHLNMAGNVVNNALPCHTKACDLAEVVGDLAGSVAVVAEPLGVSIDFHCPAGDFITMADRELLETMLLNLISNSLLHTETGGHIDVRLSRTGSRFVLAVDDNGCGMTAEKLSTLFTVNKPFDLSDAKAGAGLGLIIAKGIAEKHGGMLLVEAQPEGGCRVRISMPHRPPEGTCLSAATIPYEVKDMHGILTELSSVLPSRVYQEKFFD